MKKVIRYTLGIIGILLLITNAPLALTALWDVFYPPEDSSQGITIGVTLFFMALAACGGALVWYQLWLPRRNRDSTQAREDARLQTILELARDKGGKLTVYDAALHPDITTDEAKQGLEALVKDGLAYNYVTPEGTMLYIFGDAKPHGELQDI
ncbi:MAG: hypothetical protein AAF267_23700 [Deinococcota bacterium]